MPKKASSKSSKSRASKLTIRKRNGDVVSFDQEKIAHAVERAMRASGEFQEKIPEAIGNDIFEDIKKETKASPSYTPTVEGIQDRVEAALVRRNLAQTAKAYILYRAKRSETRHEHGVISQYVRDLALESKKYFTGNPLGEFVYIRTYARWKKDEGRRETWIETVDRYMDFMKENLGEKVKKSEYKEIREAILKQEVMPSMRLMQFAGEPARRCNTCAYNCSYLAPSELTDFAEAMYLSMQGCGVGFTVESENIQKLPQIKKQDKTARKLPTHVVVDSKEGWCDALTLGLKTWYSGKDIDFDYSEVRPAGARLKTMGGKASGPEPLRALLNFARGKIMERQGKRLRNIDAHDILCKIGECVVSGGVRRTAMISLSDLDDPEMRDAKKGQFFLTQPQRAMANNSAIYNEAPSNTELMEEWIALMKSGSGERGIFNRGSIVDTIPKRRLEFFKKEGIVDDEGTVTAHIGANPCGEILLQSKQFCNLSEVIARKGDTKEDLIRKTRIASILGTYQSTLTNFKYVSKEWKKNCDSEHLLGVSITGQWDCDTVRKPEMLRAMKDKAVKTNATYAKRFGVKQSTAVTAVKPSGTVSQTFDTSSGIHARYAKYYIRRVRISATDSLFKMLKDQGVTYYPEVGQTEENATTYVLEFPVKSPGTIFKDSQSALGQLEYWKNVKLNFTEHNPSATISVGDDEWISVLNWLQENWKIVGGLSFLPRTDTVYRLAPYEEVSKERYEEMAKALPNIDYSKLLTYELEDGTDQKKELACVGGICDVDVDVPLEEVRDVNEK